MICTLQHKSHIIQFDTSEGTSLSIPILFTEKYLSAFGVGAPQKKPYAVEGFVGSVHKGGSCNCDVIEMIPHCHTTHTECVGHVLDQPIFVQDVLSEHLFFATLITVTPPNFAITAAALEDKVKVRDAQALIIRTFPNDISKKTQHYQEQAPYLTKDAIKWMNENGIQHVLVDFPSIDPIRDGGKLEAHRAFWNLSADQKEITENTWKHKTVTELIFVPNGVADGNYVLNLQASNFNLDAAPSTPIIYPARKQ